MARTVLIVDCETGPRQECRKWVKPAANLKDPAKVAASIEERADKLSVDINGARIVVLGYFDPTKPEPVVTVCRDEDEEKNALADFWLTWSKIRTRSVNAQIAGFYARMFDLPLLIRRSQLLGVTPEHVSLARYGRGDVLDLYDELTFHESRHDNVVPCSLDVFCQQFGIDVPDTIDGSMVPALVAAGDLEPVREHNRADLYRVGLLGARLGYFDCRVPALV
jgi:hypothetical protein